jgi:hypothetical protein
MEDIIGLLKKVAEKPVGGEIVYVNNRLLDDLFETRFGGITKLVQSIEQTSEQALKAQAGIGLGGVLAKLFLDLKASIKVEGKIGEKTKTVIEKELTLQKKIGMCEASLDDRDLITANPQAVVLVPGKYLKLVDLLSTFTSGDEIRLAAAVGADAAEVILARWRKDQALTPTSPQVALVTRQPFCMAAIVKVQPELAGSTYIAYPPPPPKHRSLLAERLLEERGVTFLKTYWIIDMDFR